MINIIGPNYEEALIVTAKVGMFTLSINILLYLYVLLSIYVTKTLRWGTAIMYIVTMTIILTALFVVFSWSDYTSI